MQVFITHTQYHILCVLSIIADRENHEPCLIFHITPDANAKLRDCNLAIDSEIEIRAIDYNENVVDECLAKAFKNLLDTLQKVSIGELFLCNQHTLLASYLTKRFTNSFLIGLIQDGLKPYGSINKLAPRWRLQSWLKWQKAVWQINLPFVFINVPSLKYGKLAGIKNLWLSLPEAFKTTTNQKIRSFNFLGHPKAIAWASSFFRAEQLTSQLGAKPTVFYLSQPSENIRFQEFEISTIEWLRDVFPNHLLYVKLHPSNKFKQQNEELSKIEGIQVIRQAVPAELFIAALPAGSLVISAWSAASIFKGNAAHYWLHPIMQQRKLVLSGLKISNPTRHIIELDSLDKLIA